jgi:hypothetical protein
VYKQIAVPFLTYGSETRTVIKIDQNNTHIAEVKFLREAAGYTTLGCK